jgi:AcrR family transcriptional regulator
VKKSVAPVTEVVQGALQALEAHTRRGGTAVSANRSDGRIDGRSSRWAAHRAARRDELIDAAIAAVSRHGAGVGMDQIAAVAGTSKPVIYRYFTDKDDLYRAITHRVVGQVLDTLAGVIEQKPEPQELFHAGVDAYLGLLEATPELYRFVEQHPLVPETEPGKPTDFRTVVAGLLAGQLEEHLREIGLSPECAHPWSECIVGFLDGATVWWLDHRDVMTREQLGNYLSSLLWGGAAGVYQQAGRRVDATPAPGVFLRG